jgi:hypothetical protein
MGSSFDVLFSDSYFWNLSCSQPEPVCHGQCLGPRACEPFTRLAQRETQLPALQHVARSHDVRHCHHNVGLLAAIFLSFNPLQRPTTCSPLSLLEADRGQRWVPLLPSEEHSNHGCSNSSSPQCLLRTFERSTRYHAQSTVESSSTHHRAGLMPYTFVSRGPHGHHSGTQ